MRARTHVASVLLLLGASLPLLAMPTGTIEVKATGTRYEDVEYKIDGNLVHAKTKFGPATWNRGDVIIYESSGPKPGTEEAGEEVEGGQVEVPRHWDLASRCMLEPPAEWEVVSRSSPLVRVQLRHQTRDASLMVSVRPATGEWTFDSRANKGELEEITRDLEAQYAKVAGNRPAPVELWGSPVYKLTNLRVTEFGEGKEEKSLHEVRFRRYGLEYAVTLLVGRADQGALVPHADALLGSFSFLAPVWEQDGAVIDFTRGYAIASPGGEWQLESRPFEEDQPLRLVFDGGRGEVAVQVIKGKRDANEIVGDLIAERRNSSSYFDIKDQGKAERDGLEVVTFAFEDFREKGRNVRMKFHGFAAHIGDQGLLFMGRAPITDADASKVQGEVARALEGVRLFDLARLTERATRAQNALSLVASGHKAWVEKRHAEAIDRLGQALDLAPDYSRALYLRALARKDAKDFDGFKADLQQASQLDPDGGYDAVLGPSYAEESEVEARAKNWSRAADLRLKAWRATKDDRHQQPWLTYLRGLWTDGYVKDKQFDRGLKELESKTKDMLGRAPVKDFLFRTIREGIQNMVREQDFGKAKAWVRKLKRMDNDPKSKTEIDQLSKQIADAEARRKQGG